MKIVVRLRMVMLPLALAILLAFLAGVPSGAYALSGPAANNPLGRNQAFAASNTAMLTYKNDTYHSGSNRNETFLTPNNVNPLQFGKRASYSVDGQVYAQPLFMPNVPVNGGVPRNVVFIATENNSVYAFNADATGSNNAPLWHINFGSPVSSNSVTCNDLTPVIGITSTPVIVPGSASGTGTMFVVSYTNEGGSLRYRLHALDITTGKEEAGSPSSPISTSNFSTNRERQRSALLYANGQIYMAFASFCDQQTYHGFVISYTYNGSDFTQQHVYNDTPGGSEAGIWGGAGAVTADSAGFIYFMTGNGTFTTDAKNTGDSFVKLSSSLSSTPTDYFTPFNQSCLASADADLGSGGPLLLSSTNGMIGAGKEGRIYVINRNNMGHYNNPYGSSVCSNQSSTSADHIVQEFPPHTVGGIYSTPSTWTSSSGTQYVYFSGVGDNIKAYTYNTSTGKLSGSPTSKTPETMGGKGGSNTVISSNGGDAGILWAIDPSGVLRAYDATNLAHELYNSKQNPGRDGFVGSSVKFSAPTVANGRVFVGESNAVDIYGELLLRPSPDGYNNVGISDDSNTSTANYDGQLNSYSAEALQSAGFTPGTSIATNGYTFQWPNAQPGELDNCLANGRTIAVGVNNGTTTLGFLGSATDGAASGTVTINFTDGSTQTFTLGFTDWASGTTSFGNQIVATLSYRNTPSGKQTTRVYIFLAQVTLTTPPGATVKNVTLPSNVSGGQLHVFAVATK
jgi:hypothetical protein